MRININMEKNGQYGDKCTEVENKVGASWWEKWDLPPNGVVIEKFGGEKVGHVPRCKAKSGEIYPEIKGEGGGSVEDGRKRSSGGEKVRYKKKLKKIKLLNTKFF